MVIFNTVMVLGFVSLLVSSVFLHRAIQDSARRNSSESAQEKTEYSSDNY